MQKIIKKEKDAKDEKDKVIYIITGIGGFIGINTCIDLLKNSTSKIYGYDISTKNLKNILNKENISMDNLILIDTDLSKVDTNFWVEVFSVGDNIRCIHLASTVGVQKVIGYPESMIQDLKLNISLVEALNIIPEKIEFVFTSTSEIYGNTKVKSESGPMILNTPENNPRGTYASQKLTAENLFLNCINKHNIKILRLFSLVGKYQNPNFVFSGFINKALNNLPIVIHGNGSQSRNFTDVNVIPEIIQNKMFWKDPQRIFNIGSIRNHLTIHQLAYLIIKKLDSSSEVSYCTGPIGEQARVPQIQRIQNFKLDAINTTINTCIDLVVDSITKEDNEGNEDTKNKSYEK